MDSNVLIMTTNMVFNAFIFTLVAKLYILPNLNRWQPRMFLLPILLLEGTRHLGLMFLASGAVAAGMPHGFAIPAALGDFASALIALSTIPLVLNSSKYARPMLWLLTIFGTLDFFTAIALAVAFHATPFMGAAWWIPSFWVPGLLVAHFVTYKFLTLKPANN